MGPAADWLLLGINASRALPAVGFVFPVVPSSTEPEVGVVLLGGLPRRRVFRRLLRRGARDLEGSPVLLPPVRVRIARPLILLSLLLLSLRRNLGAWLCLAWWELPWWHRWSQDPLRLKRLLKG